MEMLSQYVVLMVLGICYCLGYIIKHSITFIPNKYIPLIMAITGTVINSWINDWTFSAEILLGGLASGLASTGAFELVKSFTGEKVKKNNIKNSSKIFDKKEKGKKDEN